MKLKVKELRTRLGWSGEHLASLAKVSTPYISEIETGKKIPSVKTIQKLATALGVHPTELIDTSGDEVLGEHMRIMRDLSPEDQEAVARHALALLQKSAR